MASKLFEVGDLVWAKMKGFAPWPAQIKEPPKDTKSPSKSKLQNYVFFFGSKNYAWIPKNNIFLHSEEMVQAANLKKKSSQMQSAINEILLLSAKQPEKVKEQSRESDSKANISKKCSAKKRNAENEEEAVPLKKRQRKRKSSERDIDEGDRSSRKIIYSKEHVKDLSNNKNQRNEENSSLLPKRPRHGKPSNVKPQPSPAVNSSNRPVPDNIIIKNDTYAKFLSKLKAGENIGKLLHYHSKRNPPPIIPKPPLYIKKPSSELDILTVCNYVKNKKVVATNKKIGFIGLGTIGQGIVKSLLNTGHDVMLWNRTPERCEPFISAGAQRASTPAEVVLKSDIIFSCLKDQEAVKAVVFYREGVLVGFARSPKPGKIYAEMTLIDKQLSENIQVHIVEHGGKYLEAGFYGTKEMAETGKLVLTVAGAPDAYKDCESCFSAMSETAEYTGRDLGNVSNIAIQSFEAKLTAAFSEIFCMAKKANVSRNDFFKFLKLSPYYSELMKDTGEAILSQDYSPKVSVSRALNVMKLASESSSSAGSFVGPAVRRLYAKAEKFNYGAHDMSAAYLMYD